MRQNGRFLPLVFERDDTFRAGRRHRVARHPCQSGPDAGGRWRDDARGRVRGSSHVRWFAFGVAYLIATESTGGGRAQGG